VKGPPVKDDMAPPVASAPPPDENEYEYYYYDDYDTGTTEEPSGEKENAVKELAEKIGEKMHGKGLTQSYTES